MTKKTSQNTTKKDSEVPWISEAKIILGEEAFNKSPLSIIAEKKWANACTLEHKKGIFIKAGTELDCIYLLIKGRVGIGGHHNSYYVERLVVEPFSFIGEIEAPMQIVTSISSKNYLFKKSTFQDYAWVSSELLSKLMAWENLQYTIGTNYDDTLTLLGPFKDRGCNGNKDKCSAYKKLNLKGDNCQKESDSYLDDCKVKKYNIYTQEQEAIVLKIPLEQIQNILKDADLSQYMYQDSFIKSKKYCYIADVPELGDKLISVYHYAENNNLLTNGSLYIIGKDRLNAVTGVSNADTWDKRIDWANEFLNSNQRKQETEKEKNRKAIANSWRNKIKVNDYLTKNDFSWNVILNPPKDTIDSVLPTALLAEVWKLDSGSRGGNKSVYKISRMINT